MADNNISTTDLLQAGLRAESQRQGAIASNIANIDTPGYRSLRVKFEQALEKAVKKGDVEDVSNVKTELYSPNQTVLKSNGNDVDLDAEVSEMVKNTLRHKTYTLLLKKSYGQIRAAINTKA